MRGRGLMLGLVAFVVVSASVLAGDVAAQSAAGASASPGNSDVRPSGAASALASDIHETVERVKVQLKLRNGRPWSGEMVVTHYKPQGSGPFPVIVLSHGRSSASRHDPGRFRMLAVARFWTRRGFAVIVPTRVGYGELGQDVDPEASGACERADYRPAIEAMGQQIEAAVVFGQGLGWVDRSRVVLAGVSYGGFGTVGAAARGIPGVVGAINFVGGFGGSPNTSPQEPCQGHRSSEIAAAAGEKTRFHTLWLYAENDRYWGAAWPRRWHEAFSAAGGSATFSSFPAVGEDGHNLLSEGFAQWRPVVDSYLTSIGFVVPRASVRLPESHYAGLGDADKIPHVKDTVKAESYPKFLAADLPRAFAISSSGAWAWRSGVDAVDTALARCQMHSRVPCALYAVDDRVVWEPAREKSARRP